MRSGILIHDCIIHLVLGIAQIKALEEPVGTTVTLLVGSIDDIIELGGVAFSSLKTACCVFQIDQLSHIFIEDRIFNGFSMEVHLSSVFHRCVLFHQKEVNASVHAF